MLLATHWSLVGAKGSQNLFIYTYATQFFFKKTLFKFVNVYATLRKHLKNASCNTHGAFTPFYTKNIYLTYVISTYGNGTHGMGGTHRLGGTHDMGWYPRHGVVPMAWGGTHDVGWYSRRGVVPIAWSGTHGVGVVPTAWDHPRHGMVPTAWVVLTAWGGTHGMVWYSWHGVVPTAWVVPRLR